MFRLNSKFRYYITLHCLRSFKRSFSETCESWRTGTRVVSNSVDARGAVLARILSGRAVVDVGAAQRSGETSRAATFVPVYQVEAYLAVGALNGNALVDVVLAVESFEAGQTLAVEPQLRTGRDAAGAVLAGIRSASVELVVAVTAGKLGSTLARVVVDAIHAGTSVGANTRSAIVTVRLKMHTCNSSVENRRICSCIHAKLHLSTSFSIRISRDLDFLLYKK